MIIGDQTAFPFVVARLDRSFEREAFNPSPIFRDIQKIGDGNRRHAKSAIAFVGDKAIGRQTR